MMRDNSEELPEANLSLFRHDFVAMRGAVPSTLGLISSMKLSRFWHGATCHARILHPHHSCQRNRCHQGQVMLSAFCILPKVDDERATAPGHGTVLEKSNAGLSK